jgi:hypothetical protein
MERFFVAGEGEDAAVLWRPELCPHVLRLRAVSASSAEGAIAIADLTALPHLISGVEDGLGRLHLLYRQSARQLQIEISGAAPMREAPLLLMLPAIMDRAVLARQVDALRAFDALRGSGALPVWYDRPASRGIRLALVRTALDFWLAGRPQREIAVALFGAARVERDWGDPGEHCRDQVRRAIARGRWLMTGGYRCLLR